jgi:hypothetical protein
MFWFWVIIDSPKRFVCSVHSNFHISQFLFFFVLMLHSYLSICLSVYLSVYLWLYSPLLDLGCFISFFILYTVGRTSWTGDQPVSRPLSTHGTTQTQNKRTQTSMPWVGFEPTIPVFERAKTVHALDRAATVTGSFLVIQNYLGREFLAAVTVTYTSTLNVKTLFSSRTTWRCTPEYHALHFLSFVPWYM